MINALYYWAALRATSNQEMSHVYLKKTGKMADEAPRSLCMSHPCFNVTDFLQGGDGSFQVFWRTDLEVSLE